VHLLRSAVVGVLCGALVATVGPLASLETAASAASASAASSAPDKKPTRKRYEVAPGITFNSPIGSRATKNKINTKIIGAINHARPRSMIKIMTWNFQSPQAANALLNAQARGVVVRLLMDASNSDADTPNPSFVRLRNELAAHNGKKKPERRSVAKTCKGSCRGKGGSAHAKFFLFGRTGGSRQVLMQGSANLTVAAATNQWNELFTTVDQKDVFTYATHVFDQMWRDKPAKAPYTTFSRGRYALTFSPYAGKNFKGDPVQHTLDKVGCRGAVKSGNSRGRTIVRSAPDVIRGNRGMAAAKRLKALWDRGCDVRIVYTVMGVAARKVLRAPGGRGAVPMRHLVQDFDGDGDFDNYFHIKVLTINGVVGKNRTTFITFNGSSNTSDLATHSDENIGTLEGRGYLRRYQSHIDYWFEHPPPDGEYDGTGNGGGGGGAARLAPPRVVDPYVNVDLD
jgi:phosphatidylserine/phosphatidylglycerophosphate/cardiolipin synthase-like enzyme